ncbi:MAG: response regulator [Deltaproteobacteria bacterium]|nr:response regulator [Deltaproteobacteria bacterium]
MKILIVDDKEDNRYLLEALLKGIGHHVQSAENGAEALESLKAGGIELIISDILMPVMDGFQFCRKVKTDETLRHIPFIIYTATYTGPQDEEFAIKIGADRFILKPCEPDVFVRAIEEVMEAASRSDRAPAPEAVKEEEVLKLYSERLVRKLEKKMLQAEHEIQARQEAEEALRISNSRLSLALESSNIGLWDWSADTEDVWFSPEWKRQIGYEDHEIPDRYEEWENRLHPEDRSRILAEVDECLEGRRPDYHAEFRLRHKDGGYRWIAASGKLVSGADKVSLRFMGCHVDITERKQVEAEMERLMLAINETGEIVFITDVDGTIQYVNPAFVKATGYTQEEVLGQNPRMLKSGKQDDAFYQDLWGTITSGKTWKGRIVNKRKNGQLYTEEAIISPVCNAAGRVVNYVAVNRDITEQLRLEAQLFQAQKMESVGRLAGGVAHDYNNMLSVILAYTELAMDKVKPADPLRDDLQEILNAAERSVDLTRQLLAFARKQTISPQVVDLNETIEGMLQMLRRLIGEDIDLAWLPSTDLWPVKVDISQINQILANLCVNSRDAITGVGRITIETGNITLDEVFCDYHMGAVPGEFVLLTVSDDGSGMKGEIMGKIFEPFFTTKEVGRGTGLGLATVYGIVKQNEGFIYVYSEPEKGTAFKIYLPRYAGAKEIGKKEAVEIPKGRGETVLVVEDEISVLKLVDRILDGLGYKVLIAGTAEEAMGLAEKHSGEIHLMITDVIMPESNGRDLAEQVKALHPDIKTLFMSGFTADMITRQGVLEEGVHFIQKPFSTADLAVKVRDMLDNATA